MHSHSCARLNRNHWRIRVKCWHFPCLLFGTWNARRYSHSTECYCSWIFPSRRHTDRHAMWNDALQWPTIERRARRESQNGGEREVRADTHRMMRPMCGDKRHPNKRTNRIKQQQIRKIANREWKKLPNGIPLWVLARGQKMFVYISVFNLFAWNFFFLPFFFVGSILVQCTKRCAMVRWLRTIFAFVFFFLLRPHQRNCLHIL